MERYLGADVHARSTTFEVLSASGKRVRRDVIEINGQALVGYLKQLAGNLHLCIEEGEWSQWLVEILSPHLAELVVVPGEWKPGPKSDAIDAHELADRIRTGRLKRRVYKDPRRFTALREYSCVYTMVTRDVARTKLRMKSIFRGRGIPCSGDAIYSDAGRANKIRLLPDPTRRVVELLAQHQSQPHAQGHLQGSRDLGDLSYEVGPSERCLSSSLGEWHETRLGQADHRTKDRGDRPGHVEEAGTLPPGDASSDQRGLRPSRGDASVFLSVGSSSVSG